MDGHELMGGDRTNDRTGGFIAVHRKLLENPLVTQLPATWFRIFIVILLRVNWKPGVWWNGRENVTIQPGSMVTSIEKLSQMSSSTPRQVRGLLAHLQATNAATIQATSRYTLITITNWGFYQNQPEADDTARDKPEGNQTTSRRQSNDELTTTIEEGNKGVSEKGEQHHHQRDDVAAAPLKEKLTPEEAEVFELAEVQSTPANLRFVRELVASGTPFEQVRFGVAVGIARRMESQSKALAAGRRPLLPLRSMRYFAPIIEEVPKIEAEFGLAHLERYPGWIRDHRPGGRFAEFHGANSERVADSNDPVDQVA